MRYHERDDQEVSIWQGEIEESHAQKICHVSAGLAE